MGDFWQNQKRPFFVLAPMAGITDSPFRQMCKGYGADVVVSEMVSATALFYNDEKSRALMRFDKCERPYVVQLFGNDPAHFAAAAGYIAREVGPDGIDINFGCPVPKIVKQGAGIALFADPKRSREVIKAVVGSSDLPVSIKTRTAYKDARLLPFLDRIRDLPIAALMVHGRNASAGYSGPVDADAIRQARGHFNGLIIANGGVRDRESAQALLKATGADGIGIAQGALGRPWIFKAVRTGQSVVRSPRAVFKEALRHARLMLELKGQGSMVEMRKHLAWYVSGLPGAKRLREELIRIDDIGQIKGIFFKYLQKLGN